MEIPKIAIHDTDTGKTITRDMTADEIAALPEPTNEVPATDV